jgi:hypothetical protein
MEAGDAHKMGIYHMNNKKTRPSQIPGAVRSGKVFRIHFGGKTIEFSHTFKKVPDRFYSPATVTGQEKAKDTHPKGDKIQVYPDPLGGKWYFQIQGMIHRRHRDAAGKQSGFILKKEKMVHDRMNAAQGGTAEGRGAHYLQYRPRQRLFLYHGVPAASLHENHDSSF